jgi:hypothetical protein
VDQGGGSVGGEADNALLLDDFLEPFLDNGDL